jgi:hypothetical protein
MAAPADYPKEWEECLDQMDKFDGYLIDARKYGFTLITGLTTASSFLGFSDAAKSIQLGVIIVTLVLVFVLYLIDTYYQNLLNRMLLRAKRIEEVNIKGRELAHYLSKIYNEGVMSYMIFGVYVGFVLALDVLGYYAISAAESQMNNSNILPTGLVQTQEVQGASDPLYIFSKTAYLWIPLAVTSVVIVVLLVKIFLDQRTEKKRIRAAMRVIEGARKRLERFDAIKDETDWSRENEEIEREILRKLEGEEERTNKDKSSTQDGEEDKDQ